MENGEEKPMEGPYQIARDTMRFADDLREEQP
jgi:hypothetical protein